jgi:hypothetical protein
MSKARRAVQAFRATIQDPQERRAYKARLMWLIQGSNTLEAHSIEYRAGLRGLRQIAVDRLAPEPEVIRSCPDDCSAYAPLTHVYEARDVYLLRNTVVSTMSGATIATKTTEPDFFIRESITWPFESILTHGLEIPNVSESEEEISGTSIVFPTTKNYYHWLIEELPAVLRAVEADPLAGLISFAGGITPHHEIVSVFLGKIISRVPVLVKLEQQVLAGRSDGNWFAHPNDILRLRRFGSDLVDEARSDSKRIYVSRRFSQRSMPGEEELELLLARADFKIVFLEQLTWPEQISLFRGADFVVGAHGAGLANLVFSDPDTTLLELTSGAMYNRCYEWLCHASGNQYFGFQVDGEAVAGSNFGLSSPEVIAEMVMGTLALAVGPLERSKGESSGRVD